MAVCGVCTESCDKSGEAVIKCTGDCGGHFHQACLSDKFPELNRRTKKEWICEKCKLTKTVTGSSKQAEGTSVSESFMVDLMANFKKEFMKELQNYSSEFQDFKNSLEFFSSKVDETTAALTEVKNQYSEIKKENTEIKKQNAALTACVRSLEMKVRDLEQYSRRSNIEVNGVPVTPHENAKEILRDVGRAIGVELQGSDVVAVHRVRAFKSTRTPALIAKFNTRELRDTWLQKYKQKKTLHANEINPALGTSRIYIGEHLSPDNKLLKAKLKETASELGVKYVWAKEGKFYVRKNDGMQSYRVESVEELKRLKL